MKQFLFGLKTHKENGSRRIKMRTCSSYLLTHVWLIVLLDSAVRMEINELGKQLVQKLEKQPSTSNVGIYAQQADYRTEFWQKGLAEMDQAIETQPQNATPFRY